MKRIGILSVAPFADRHRRIGAARHNHTYLSANQVSRQRRQTIALTLRPTVFNRQVPAFDVAYLAQALAKGRYSIRERSR